MAARELGPAGSPSMVARARLTVELSAFNAKLDAYGKALGQDLDQLVATSALILVGRIQARTPVRTGRARASWHAVLFGRSGAFAYKDNAGRSFDGTLAEPPPGPGMALVGSNVEYMLPLEAGWSKQAPTGMVRISVAEFRETFAQKIKEVLAKRRSL